jgi:hypothetical protein
MTPRKGESHEDFLVRRREPERKWRATPERQEYMRKWRKANREKVAGYNGAYHAAHRKVLAP